MSLLSRVKSNDAAAKEAMIVTHLKLSACIARRYKDKGVDLPTLISAAYFGVVFAVDRISKGLMSHDNVTGYIIIHIRTMCRQALRHRSAVTAARYSTVPVHSATEFAIIDTDFVALRDVLDSITQNQCEREIMILRSKGYTDAEVAAHMNMSCSTVRRIRLSLWNRYQKASMS